MERESPRPASTPRGAVFLSYASQDTEGAQKICDALRAAGIEVWFDKSELRGGDVWDQKIRRQIHDCTLFIPLISANTASRHEGYFRLEWDLADQRTHMMARDRAFIVPVCLDATPGAGTDVPESFQRVQWTRLPSGETPREFVAQIARLLSPDRPTPNQRPAGAASGSAAILLAAHERSWWNRALPATVVVLVVGTLGYLLADKFLSAQHNARSPPASSREVTTHPPTDTAAFNPPAHSIAVLPFVNMSGDKDQEYFSDGLTEELLNSLARINELQVAGRTSSFYFKGEHVDLTTIAHKLNVASVLEGSVRRSAHTVRVTAQLINAGTGFHLWSATYDRNLGDVLKLQTEIADAVAGALKITLLGDVAAKIELGGTRNPAAFDAYLRGAKASREISKSAAENAIAEYSEAIRLDPNYALAFAGRSQEYSGYADDFAVGAAAVRESADNALKDARTAIAIAPELAEGHVALARYFEGGSLEFASANEEYERATALAPGNAALLRNYGRFAAFMGRADVGVATARRAVAVDPLNPLTHSHLGQALLAARRFAEALLSFDEYRALIPGSSEAVGSRAIVQYALGDFQGARAACEGKPDSWQIQLCLALVYEKLGQHRKAEGVLARMQAAMGDTAAYQYGEIYAQWGNKALALEWLETALRVRDPGLVGLRSDVLIDPVRNEPRFQTIKRALKFPD
jgi:TolB-like protein